MAGPKALASAAVSLCLLLGACSTSPDAVSDLGTSASKDDAAEDGKGSKMGAPGGDKDNPGDGGRGDGGSDPAPEPSDGPGGKGPERPGAASGGGPARSSTRLSDPAEDLESRGDPPGYVDLTGLAVESGPETVTFTVNVAGPFPSEMPDQETNALVTIGFQKSGDEYFIQGEASTDGWSASMSKNGRSVEYRGRFGIAGDRMTFSVPWADAGGPGRLRWSVDTSWTHTTTLDTDYAFDRAPQFGRQPFSDRGA